MFSHTHKGQEYNTPLLSRFLHGSDSRTATPDASHLLPSLIDWELLTDANGKRTVGFGWYAGGMLNLFAHSDNLLHFSDPFYLHFSCRGS